MKKKIGNRPQTQISLLLQLFMAVMFLAGATVLHIHFSRCSQQLFGSKKDRELSKAA